jgi:hypothetical protein
LIKEPAGHQANMDDVICLVKQHLSDASFKQALVLVPHRQFDRLPTAVPVACQARKSMGQIAQKWAELACRFEEQHPDPRFCRAGQYLRALAVGKCGDGKMPEPLPWHNRPSLDFQGVLVGRVPEEVLQSAPLRARWS